MTLARGTVVVVVLDPTLGREQAGRRPCVVVGDPRHLSALRFPLIAVVPLTSTQLGSFYPVVRPIPGSGLRTHSTALIDNIRSVDPSRVVSAAGLIDAEDLRTIDATLARFLGL